MSTSDVLKTYQNIASGLQHQILLIYYTLNKTLLPKTVLSLNWSFRKLEVEMVQYANDILEKRKCSETLRIASPVIWPTALMIKILSFRVNSFFSKSNKLGYATNICSSFYLNYHLFFIVIYFYSRGLMARNILIHEDGTAKVGLLTSYNTSTYKNMSISGVVGFSFFSPPLFCRNVNCQSSFS